MTPQKEFLDLLCKHFNLEEIKHLCFQLGVEEDEIPGETRTKKAINLLIHSNSQNLLPNLLEAVKQERPNVDWPKTPPALPYTTKSKTKAGRIRQALIEHIRTQWIQGVLEKSLYKQARIALQLTTSNEYIDRPKGMLLAQRSEGEAEIHSSITSVFTTFPGGLLLLGEPGAGKTTILLELARDLLDFAEFDEDQDIPLVLNLSSWATSRKPLEEWIVEQLNRNYLVNKKYAKKWIEDEPFHLLLDGLDEVDEKYREDCVVAINQFRLDFGLTKIVVCSRINDYKILSTKLRMYGAIKILPLDMDQVKNYFESSGEALSSIKEFVLKGEIAEDLISSPLMLSIISLAYENRSPSELIAGSLSERKHLVFSTYVKRMFARRDVNENYSEANAKIWLKNIATNLQNTNQSIFYLENLQPSWIAKDKQYLALIGLVTGFLFSIFFGLLRSINTNLIEGLLYGLRTSLIIGPFVALNGILSLSIKKNSTLRYIALVLFNGILWALIFIFVGNYRYWLENGLFIERLLYGFVFGLFVGAVMGFVFFETTINTVEKVSLGVPSLSEISSRFRKGCLNSILIFFVGLLVFGCLVSFPDIPIVILQLVSARGAAAIGSAIGAFLAVVIAGPLLAFALSPIFSVIIGFLGALTAFIQFKQIEEKLVTNIGIRNSLINGLSMSLIIGGSGALIGALLDSRFDGKGVFTISIFGILFIVFFNYFGGRTIIKHYSLRILLHIYNVIPFKIVPFLDNMTERIFLLKVGGGYIFIHRTLLEYFTSIEDS